VGSGLAATDQASREGGETMARKVFIIAVLAALALVIVAAPAVAKEGEKRTIVVKSGDDDELLIKGSRGTWLGVGIAEIKKKGEKAPLEGVLITEIYEDSPAEAAGLKEDDIVVAIDDKKTDDVDELVKAIQAREPGDEISMTIDRDGKEQIVIATLSERPEEYVWLDKDDFLGLAELGTALGNLYIPEINIGFSGFGGRGRLGVYVHDLSEGLAEYFEVPDGEGVLVDDIVEDSPADAAGIKAGDVIVRIGDEDVADTEELVDAISEMDRDTPTPIVLIRKGERLTVEATVGESEHEKALEHFKQAYMLKADDLEHKMHTMKLTDEERAELKEDLEKLREELEELKEELRAMKKD
jgi:C-terminal processing protease CtpA/Prc